MKRVFLGLAALALIGCGGGDTNTGDDFDGDETAGGELLEDQCRLAETPIATYRLPVLPDGFDLLEPHHREPFDLAQAVLGQSAPEPPENPTDEDIQQWAEGPYTEFLSQHREALLEAETALNALSTEDPDVRVVASTLVALMYYHLAVEMLRAPTPPSIQEDPALAGAYYDAIAHGVQPVLHNASDRAEYCVYTSAQAEELHRWRVYCFSLIGHTVVQAHHVHSLVRELEAQANSTEYIVRRWGAPRPGTSLGTHAHVEGGLTNTEVASFVHAHQTPLLACYHRALDERPNLHGQVVLSFDIGADGAVTDVQTTVSTVGDDVAQCLSTAFGEFDFPDPHESDSARAQVAIDLRVIPVSNEEHADEEGGGEAASSEAEPEATEAEAAE